MVKSTDVRLAVLEEKHKALRSEIKKQAKEYQRRLAELNHAHDKQVQDQQTYVSEDKFAGWQGEIGSWRNQVSKTLAELEGRSAGGGSARALFFQILPLLISILALVAILWKR